MAINNTRIWIGWFRCFRLCIVQSSILLFIYSHPKKDRKVFQGCFIYIWYSINSPSFPRFYLFGTSLHIITVFCDLSLHSDIVRHIQDNFHAHFWCPKLSSTERYWSTNPFVAFCCYNVHYGYSYHHYCFTLLFCYDWHYIMIVISQCYTNCQLIVYQW